MLFLELFGPDAPEGWQGCHPLDEDLVRILHDRARGDDESLLDADAAALLRELEIRRKGPPEASARRPGLFP